MTISNFPFLSKIFDRQKQCKIDFMVGKFLNHWFFYDFEIARFFESILIFNNFRDFSSIQIENNLKSFSWIWVNWKSLFLTWMVFENFDRDYSVQNFNFDHVLTKTSKICFIIFGPVSKAFEPSRKSILLLKSPF